MRCIKQIYRAEVEIYKGHRVSLGGGTTLRFKYNEVLDYYSELDCGLYKENQKTLSSVKPTEVIIKSGLTVEDSGIINLNDKFTISDGFDKLVKGRIIEVIKQL